MEYESLIFEAVEFIHQRYAEDILVEDIAEHVYLSVSYFAYLFRIVTGFSVKDYLNRYRLYRAALDLYETDRRIIDIVFDSGFSSQQAFTKSFTRTYVLPPAMFRRLKPNIDPFPPLKVSIEGEERKMKNTERFKEIPEIMDSVKFVRKDKFYVIGIEVDLDYTKGYISDNREYNYSEWYAVSNLYKRWYDDNLIDKIPDKVNSPSVCYGITHDSRENNTAKYLICAEVSSIENIPQGFVWYEFAAQEYAVFSGTTEMEADLIYKWKLHRHIFKYWIKEQELQIPERIYGNTDKCFTKLPVIYMFDSDEYLHDYFDGLNQVYVPIQRK